MDALLLEPLNEVNKLEWIPYQKTVDESRVSDATRKTDAELKAPIEARRRYAFRIFLSSLTVGNTPDFQFEIDGPASPVFYAAELHYFPTNGTYTTAMHTALNTAIALTGNAGRTFIEVHGIIEAIASGNISVKWAQNTSDASPTVVQAGSFIELLALQEAG